MHKRSMHKIYLWRQQPYSLKEIIYCLLLPYRPSWKFKYNHQFIRKQGRGNLLLSIRRDKDKPGECQCKTQIHWAGRRPGNRIVLLWGKVLRPNTWEVYKRRYDSAGAF